MKDDLCGEIPVAFIVQANGSEITEDEIKQYIAKQVRHAIHERYIAFISFFFFFFGGENGWHL